VTPAIVFLTVEEVEELQRRIVAET